MMDSPDVVDTSDIDEREVLAVSDWPTPTTDNQPRPDSLTTRHHWLSDHEAESPSPRKRIKVSSDLSNAGEQNSKSPSRLFSMPISVDSDRSVPFSPHSAMPQSNQHSLFPSPSRASAEHHPPDAKVGPQRAESPQTSHRTSRSLSISIAHSPPFSSSLHRHTISPQTPSQRHSNSGGRDLLLVPSSPLTPLSSPASLAHTPSPDPLRLLPARPLHSLHPQSPRFNPPPSPKVSPPPVEIPEDPQPLGRYSFRRREAWQLNPYAYDKLLYKQQLKSHPDAIVKFRSPRHRPDSSGARKDGTQDEFIFPLDNPDQDGDYVDIESNSGRRRGRRLESPDQHNTVGYGQELEREQLHVGWLPAVLRESSSSDEDVSEICKLARNARRKREKAEALTRAEARRAVAEARRERLGTTITTKQRPKPFPISKDGIPLSPSLFSPTNSEPTITTLSPKRLPLGHHTSSRATSPTPSLIPFPSPGFSDHLQQESSYPFDGGDDLLPRNLLPIDRSVSPSPSGPPTTSGASALPSNTSGIDSESDQSSIFEMNSKDRRRLRVLKRMIPAAMIARELGISSTTRPLPPRPRVAVGSSGSEAEEVRAIPGLARVRKGRYTDVEVKGDPESSDERSDDVGNKSDLGTMELSSGEQSRISVKWTQNPSRRLTRGVDVISLTDSSMLESSDEDSGSRSSDDRIHQALFHRPARGSTRERSLIDWMLSRTRGPSRPKSKPKQSAGFLKSRGSTVPRLDITTSARRHGNHHQTRLPFARTNYTSNATSSTKHGSDHRDQIMPFDQDAVEGTKKRKEKKRKSITEQGPVYNIRHDATRITSKYQQGKSGRSRAGLVIENDDSEFKQALYPGWRAEVERWNKPFSPARQPAADMTTSAPSPLKPRVYRRTSPPLQRRPLPFYFQRDGSSPPVHRQIVVDMNITPLPSGVKFGSSTYTGRGHLYQLISILSGNSEVAPPRSCNIQGFEIGPTTSAALFSASLGPLCDRLACALRSSRANEVETMKEWEPITCASGQLLSWLVVHAEDQEFAALDLAFREYSDGLLLVLGSLETTMFSLAAYWFIVELSARLVAGIKYRLGSIQARHLIQSAEQLVLRLLDIDLQPAFTTFYAAEGDIDTTSLSHRAAELWVCLIHVLPSLEISTKPAPGHPFWGLLMHLYPESSPAGAEASEDIWRMIFSLSAISQFSVHGLSTSVFRLPAAWELVAVALKKIALTSSPEKECVLPLRALKKRDDYISCVVSRCFLLWSRWGWRLDDGISMFKSLQEIFRSRNFANLLSERSAPMGFLENGDLELLSERDPHDSVFEMFLKMVVQAVCLLNANVGLDAKQRSTHVKKLLQMAVPVSPVPFSRSAPPTAHTLSMLVNRFSAMVIAVHLDTTLSNVRFRISQARRCVNFKDADDHSRVACVYGMMNFSMIVRHHKIPGGLEEVLEWLGEMADVLMDEYQEGEARAVGKKSTTTLIQLLIGSVRRVIETQSLDRGKRRPEYPDPALLDGPWVTRVFNPRADLVTIQQTGIEIRMLVQSFLDARLKALPAVRPPPPVVHIVESQESQEEYFFDLKDEELLAILGAEAEASTVSDLKSKEDALCKVLDKSITPAVYRLVCKHFGESEQVKNDTTSNKAADEWIDCWVGCANVLVQNNYKDWGLYMKLGQQSWEKIINDSWRRRVGLRFNLTLLRLDPGAYDKMKDEFIAVLLAATLSCRATIEHKFMSVVLSLDGLQHPLLHAAPFDPIAGARRYEIGEDDYEVARERIIETVFTNCARCLRARVDAESQTYVEMIVVMLSTMRDVYHSTDDHATYGGFCQRVFRMLLSHPELASHPRLSVAVGWRSDL